MIKRIDESDQWWFDTMAWIKRVPEELDSKPHVPEIHWRVFEAETWEEARNAARVSVDKDINDYSRSPAWEVCMNAARNAYYFEIFKKLTFIIHKTGRNPAFNLCQKIIFDNMFENVSDENFYVIRMAAHDACLIAAIKLCAGLPIDEKYVKHAEERWEANKRGYRVFCDLYGILYVYRGVRRNGLF
jgi:hypothetical protein